jgi:hypothetical protein
MGIKCTDPKRVTDALLLAFEEKSGANIFSVLERIGIECVTIARGRKLGEDYTDQSGNLRGSIGYVISHDGVIIGESSFDPVTGNKGTAGQEGPVMGRQYAEERVAEHYAKHGSGYYCLHVVAGMNYADYVQRLHNRDVLESAVLHAKSIVDNMKRRA